MIPRNSLAALVRNFYGNADESREAIKTRGDRQTWGTDRDSHLTIATDSVGQTLAEKQKKSAELRVERQAEQALRESDPVYQKRQADLKRYAEALQGIGTAENSWSVRDSKQTGLFERH